MTSLPEIDRALDGLGATRPDVAELVSRYGEADRSFARVDEALRALGAGVTLTGFAAPVVASVSAAARSESPAPSGRRARNLLDEELDPSEFPQTVPPPAPDTDVASAERRDASEDGFELLVDDGDILEIEDDDTQVSYERK